VRASPAVIVTVTACGGRGIVVEGYLQRFLVEYGCFELCHDAGAWQMCEAHGGGG
jgi:hypothetical protein